MGQYHYCVNVTKQEYLRGHAFGVGLKAVEQVGRHADAGAGTIGAMFFLMSFSRSRGGGDFDSEVDSYLGRWHGDHVVVMGDYAEAEDFPGCDPKFRETFTDISDAVADSFGRAIDVVYVGAAGGWRSQYDSQTLLSMGVELDGRFTIEKIAIDATKREAYLDNEIAALIGSIPYTVRETLMDFGSAGVTDSEKHVLEKLTVAKKEIEAAIKAQRAKLVQRNVTGLGGGITSRPRRSRKKKDAAASSAAAS